MTGHFLLLVDPMSVDVDGLNFCITTILAFAHFSNNFLIPALNIIITCLILAFRTATTHQRVKQILRIGQMAKMVLTWKFCGGDHFLVDLDSPDPIV